MTNLDYIRHCDKRLFTMSYGDICKIVFTIGYICPILQPPTCRECGSCVDNFLKEDYCVGAYTNFYIGLNDYIKENLCKESVKEKFTWNDMFDKNVINPCDYCSAINEFPLCDDGATSSACNHCMYNIYLHMNFEIKED